MLRLFGPLEAAVHGEPLPRLRSRTGYRLLALLALRHDCEIERDWLAGGLWPESAYRALRQAQAADGNYAAATQEYRDLRLLLHRELNPEPAAETRAIFEQIRAEARRKPSARRQAPQVGDQAPTFANVPSLGLA